MMPGRTNFYGEVACDTIDVRGQALSSATAAVAGVAEANKVPVLGANKNLDVLALASLRLGAGAGTAVTATAAELNKLAGAGAVVASGTQASTITDPTGGAIIDAESRTAINAIIDALQAFGIVA